jgi:serine/threonine protein kinase
MAEVQLAIQRGPAGFEKLVVVKLVHANLATQKAFVDMLLDEARVAALVKHPNVVDIYDLGEAEGRYFIAMEYLEGEPLLAVLRAGREGKRLDPLSTARLIADTAEGLDAAHELRSMGGDHIELVHHDVSLGNIVVLYNGQVKLVDFGVAKATMSVAPTTRVQGKFSYMAPEKLRGAPGDRRSDIWSLGCVLWEALTLRRLFKGGNDNDTMRQVLDSQIMLPSKINGDVIAEFDPIVMRALEREPEKRYPTAKEMAVELEEVLRKQGYGGRNDQIAKYMMATFDSHIVARKKLLQEVSSKGRASAAVLEAAFNDPMLASGSPISTTGDFSVRFKRATNELTAEGTPQQNRGEPLAYPRASAAEISAFAEQPPEVPVEVPVELDVTAKTAPDLGTPPSRMGRYTVVGIAAIALIGVVIYGLNRTGTNEPIAELSDPNLTPGRDRAAVSPDAATPEDPSGFRAVGATGSGSDIEIEIPPEHVGSGSAGRKKVTPKLDPKPVDKANVAELNVSGAQAFVKGDNKTALATFRRAQQANPAYAPTWRGLGMVYERLGDKSSAKSAFSRYLQLAPSAPDADVIRDRLKKL